MKVGDKVKLPRRGFLIGEIIREIPKDKPSDKRLFEVRYTNEDGRVSVATCWIDELKLEKQTKQN